MKYYITIYAITLFSLISFNFQCGKEDLQPMQIEEVAQFEKHLYIDPVKKTYNVGDTIWIKTNLSDTLLRDTKGSIFMKTDTVDFNIPLLFKVLNKQVLVPNGGFCEFVNPDQLAMSTS
ncbi:MAG TPA: hypothetical protein VL943_10430, partial [Niabella sp.]|nr:hypothetical protein [Niabella sp.]